jgi:hypothetical protein
LLNAVVLAQDNVGIGTLTPDPSSLVEVQSVDKGLLIPRLTSLQRVSIVNPTESLLVYDTNTNGFWYYNGIAWIEVAALAGNSWSPGGNSGTSDVNDFVGTIDASPFNMIVNNLPSGRIDTENSFYGYNSAQNASSLFATSATTVFGSFSNAVPAADTYFYVSLGSYAGTSSGFVNSLSGSTFVGDNITNLSQDFSNTFIGYTGDHLNYPPITWSTHIGYEMISPVSGLVEGGYDNTSIGHRVGGKLNTLVGNRPDAEQFDERNVSIGNNSSPADAQTLNDVTYLGNDVGKGVNDSVDNSTAIGSGTILVQPNTFLLGPDNGQTNVGVGVASPQAALEVNGFTKLGPTAPKIKYKKLTGTAPASEGGTVAIPHGIISDKILSVRVHIEYQPNAYVPTDYRVDPEYEYTCYFTPTNIIVVLAAGNSGQILNDPIKVVITYTE